MICGGRYGCSSLVSHSISRLGSQRSITSFAHLILLSYPAVSITVTNLFRPLHSSQVGSDTISSPLSKCIGLLRILSAQTTLTEAFPGNPFKQEMSIIMADFATYDVHHLLGAFQSYLLCSMALHALRFRCGVSGVRDHIMNLQQLASSLFSQSPATETKPWDIPDWRQWIVAEAQRWTTFTMYLLDNLICALDGLPMFVATELAALSAPAPRSLWDARDVHSWQREHNDYLSATGGVPLHLSELWTVPSSLVDDNVRQRQDRIHAWLERVDEYGMMMVAVTTATYG